jgi:hypothetical protein
MARAMFLLKHRRLPAAAARLNPSLPKIALNSLDA